MHVNSDYAVCVAVTYTDFKGPVLTHGSTVGEVDDWQTKGPRTQADISSMTGYFWKNPDVCAFGVYTPSVGVGLYHMASRSHPTSTLAALELHSTFNHVQFRDKLRLYNPLTHMRGWNGDDTW